jgi:FixJ family two-component response regulator
MMSPAVLPKLLVVDDEEAILETMMFTFMDEYEVLTSADARVGLEILDAQAPVAVVITDQRMPNMTGSEFLAEVYARHPETVRIILTGFSDVASTVDAINDGHVYAYVNKPWEPVELQRVVRRAYEHHALTLENHRLLEELSHANRFLAAVIDRLDTGALAVDVAGVIQAANQTARETLNLPASPSGVTLSEVLAREELVPIAEAFQELVSPGEGVFEEAELQVGGGARRVRVSLETLETESAEVFGRVILFREVSHEPLRRRFYDIVSGLVECSGAVRQLLEAAVAEAAALLEEIRVSGIASPGMSELGERVQRMQTAVQNWLDVDDLIATQEYPDAQLLRDRMNIAGRRWPPGEVMPERVQRLAERVEAYYESGENSRERVLS